MKKKDLEILRKQDPRKIVNVIGEIRRLPYEVLEDLSKYRLRYGIENLVSEETSHAEPPKSFDEKVEVIPIDECLGLYEPEKTKITIYEKGIQKASKIIRCNPTRLEYIVRLHEWSHAVVHIGLHKENEARLRKETHYIDIFLKQATVRYISIEPRLHEVLAQLLTYHSLKLMRQNAKHEEAVKAINRTMDTFRKLNRWQPAQYKIDEYRGVRRDRIITSLDLIKKGWLSGVFEAWNSVIRC